MSIREKVLAAVLGVMLFGAVVGFGGYLGVYQPVMSRTQTADKLETEVAEKRSKLDQLRKDLTRLPAVKAKSLPADPDVARQEYEAALSKLLREAKVPRGYTVRATDRDSRPAPELSPKKPAYSRLAFEITLKAVDLATLTDFLERYHKLGLLQQITRFHVKRADPGSTGTPRRLGSSERADLDVTLVTEAISLDGVEPRRTLRPVTPAAGAVVGVVGFQHLSQTPEVARALPAPTVDPVLATAKREYLAVVSKDPFHGPLPPPPVVASRPVEEEAPPEPPKEDVSAFIKLTGITRRSDGTAQADVKDAANNLDYQIDFAVKDGVLTPKVAKYYFLKDRRKKLDSGTDLDISDDTSSTARKFRIVGLDVDSLVLTSVAAKPDDKAAPAGGGGRFSRLKSTTPAAHPISAVAGGPAAGTPQDHVFVWRVGQPLKAVKELPGEEGLKAVERARAGWEAVPATTPVTRNEGS